MTNPEKQKLFIVREIHCRTSAVPFLGKLQMILGLGSEYSSVWLVPSDIYTAANENKPLEKIGIRMTGPMKRPETDSYIRYLLEIFENGGYNPVVEDITDQ